MSSKKYNYEYLYKNNGYKYAKLVVNDELYVIRNNKKISFKAPKYVKLQCKKFLDDLDKSQDENYPYFFSIKTLKKIGKILKLINFGDGFYCGKSFYDGLADFQWMVIINLFCWKHKANKNKRRYELIVMLTCRKNAKTCLSALIFILLMLLEPKFSEFYSVSATKDLATQLKKEIQKTIKSSVCIEDKFKTIKKEIRCKINESVFQPLANGDDTLDAKKPNVFLVDEVGALKDIYPIEAMSSGQLNMLNKLGILISTAYTEVNPMENYVDYCQNVLDGVIEDEAVFSLLYRPNNVENWLLDESIYEVNPLAVQLNNQGISDNLDYVFKKRFQAIEIPTTESNFKTKFLNIKVSHIKTVPYLLKDDLEKCKIKEYDWTNKKVLVGLDLSISGDNTAVSIMTFDNITRKYISQSWCFIPNAKIEEKSKKEKVDYNEYINKGYCFGCGNMTIDYTFIEEFICDYLIKELKVEILGVSYDRYNATSTIGKLEQKFIECIDIPQNFTTLNAPCKSFKYLVLNELYNYVENELFELNVINAQIVGNPSGSLEMISKKSSNFKIDVIASVINTFVIESQFDIKKSVYENEGIEYIDEFLNDDEDDW